MTSARPYRPALGAVAALEELQLYQGEQFDATVVGSFLRAYPDPEVLPISTPQKTRRTLPVGLTTGEVRVSSV
jgi:HD-GYP domain-containing protein (c-di-GMP phosphodiesterase class II)